MSFTQYMSDTPSLSLLLACSFSPSLRPPLPFHFSAPIPSSSLLPFPIPFPLPPSTLPLPQLYSLSSSNSTPLSLSDCLPSPSSFLSLPFVFSLHLFYLPCYCTSTTPLLPSPPLPPFFPNLFISPHPPTIRIPESVSVKNRNNELQSADPGASESDRSQLTSPEILEFPLNLDGGGSRQDDSAAIGTGKMEPSSNEDHGISDLKSAPAVNPTYAQLTVEARKKSEELKAKGTGNFCLFLYSKYKPTPPFSKLIKTLESFGLASPVHFLLVFVMIIETIF